MDSMDSDSCAQKFYVHDFGPMEVAPSEPSCDVHRRVAGAAKMILKQCHRFHRTLTVRQQVQYDFADLIQEAWSILLVDDHLYNDRRYPAEKGGYVGFVAMTLRRRFQKLRRRTRLVTVPCKADRIRRDDPDSESAVSIARVTRGIASLNANRTSTRMPAAVDEAIKREEASIARETVGRGLAQLPERDAVILDAFYLAGDGASQATGESSRLYEVLGYRDLRGLTRFRKEAEGRLAKIIGALNVV